LFSMGNLKYLGEVVREIIFHDDHLERRFTDAKPTRKERIIGNSMSIPTIQVRMKTMLPSMPKESPTSDVGSGFKPETPALFDQSLGKSVLLLQLGSNRSWDGSFDWDVVKDGHYFNVTVSHILLLWDSFSSAAASGKHPSDVFRRKLEEQKSEYGHIIPYRSRCKMKYYNLRKLDKAFTTFKTALLKNRFVHEFCLGERIAPKVENFVCSSELTLF
ncbi:hypothetical protein T4B_3442, partial [Trichinella pseudospiralis]